MLLGEHGGRHEHRDLPALGHGLERRAQRDLGLAVADVAGHQAVHGPAALQVGLTSSIARSWSGVSSKRKAASNSRCHGESAPKAGRSATERSA